MKKFYLILVVLVTVFGLMACQPKEGTQGITDTEIIIGNTAATSGLFAGVGVPFNLAMQVVFDDYNATHEGRDINFYPL